MGGVASCFVAFTNIFHARIVTWRTISAFQLCRTSSDYFHNLSRKYSNIYEGSYALRSVRQFVINLCNLSNHKCPPVMLFFLVCFSIRQFSIIISIFHATQCKAKQPYSMMHRFVHHHRMKGLKDHTTNKEIDGPNTSTRKKRRL
jgi:hypothetical protein